MEVLLLLADMMKVCVVKKVLRVSGWLGLSVLGCSVGFCCLLDAGGSSEFKGERRSYISNDRAFTPPLFPYNGRCSLSSLLFVVLLVLRVMS